MTRLKEWRERRDLSQRALSKISGVHHISLAKMEAGVIDDPRLSTLLKLCKALKINMAELVDGDGDKPSKKGRHYDSTRR
jgi:transcriptional regulator with XRE-family HTH domain